MPKVNIENKLIEFRFVNSLKGLRSNMVVNYVLRDNESIHFNPFMDTELPEVWRTAYANRLVLGQNLSYFAHVRPKYIPPVSEEEKVTPMTPQEWAEENNLEIPEEAYMLVGDTKFPNREYRVFWDRYNSYVLNLVAENAPSDIVLGGFVDTPIWFATLILDAEADNFTTPPVVGVPLRQLGPIKTLVVLLPTLPDGSGRTDAEKEVLVNAWNDYIRSEENHILNVFFVEDIEAEGGLKW